MLLWGARACVRDFINDYRRTYKDEIMEFELLTPHMMMYSSMRNSSSDPSENESHPKPTIFSSILLIGLDRKTRVTT